MSARDAIIDYCLNVLGPRANDLEREQYDAISHLRLFKWRRVHREHRQLNATWHALNEIARTL